MCVGGYIENSLNNYNQIKTFSVVEVSQILTFVETDQENPLRAKKANNSSSGSIKSSAQFGDCY